jgi:hypothetical protein
LKFKNIPKYLDLNRKEKAKEKRVYMFGPGLTELPRGASVCGALHTHRFGRYKGALWFLVDQLLRYNIL